VEQQLAHCPKPKLPSDAVYCPDRSVTPGRTTSANGCLLVNLRNSQTALPPDGNGMWQVDLEVPAVHGALAGAPPFVLRHVCPRVPEGQAVGEGFLTRVIGWSELLG
jgi:hypothetical protein